MPRRSQCHSHFAASRRGSAYLLVVFTTMIVAMISLGAILVLRGQATMAKSTSDLLEARYYALAAIEAGRAKITADASWRTNNSNGTWINNQPVGDLTRTPTSAGTYSLTVVNPNGALNRADTDPVIMTGIGYKGLAVQQVQATLTANVIPLTCLNTSLTAGSSFSGSGSITAFNQVLATNTNATASGASVNAFMEYVGSISGSTWLQTTTQVTTPRTMPDAKVFDYYKTNGTTINYSALPLGTITNVTLSPKQNPYGSGITNASGIYVIDCLGQNLTISQSRIVGTLVVLNPGVTSSCQTQVHMSPAIANYPVLMVQGGWTIKINSTSLKEGSPVNYNPAGASPPGTATPYPWGSANYDNDFSDSYPNEIKGLVYVSGNFTQFSGSNVSMVVAGGTASVTNIVLSFDPIYFPNPPPGFYTIKMVPATNGFQQTTN